MDRAGLHYYNEGVSGCGESHEFRSVPGGVQEMLPAGQLTQEKLLAAQERVSNPENLSLTLERRHYGGHDRRRLSEVPIYVHAKLLLDQVHGRPEAYEINYITLYAFNGHYAVPFGLPLFMVGHHVGDWEHLTVRLDARSLELQGVWYNAHRNIEGEWCPAADVPRTRCGRIIGHVAINGHGIYPHCGIIPRLFFAANDRTSRTGPVWSPTRIVRMCGVPQSGAPHLCPTVRSRGCALPLALAAPRPPTALHATAAADPDTDNSPSTAAADADAVQLQLQQQAPSQPPKEHLRHHDQQQQQQGNGSSAGAQRQQDAKGQQHQDLTVGWNSGDALLPQQGSGAGGAYMVPQVVHDSSPWQQFQGRWGTVIGAMHQGWFLGAEPPVSRGLLRRLFLPCAPGVDSLPPPVQRH
ncbi:hypothetical protein HXX76_008662 [Chlamydomonas incerta]|uniref:Uncharacterized protein n=1 Tax=Chlamydomonas incerta TaxID=51695 RepID=A0A835SZH6_CHLIN|nr:hypothetical protein HXX76_008662 [Chlamydomonas incerta]|eukprot:KAG2432933.1 hypothetical protein HXX76_008662 [Chlamydomonas incerta]